MEKLSDHILAGLPAALKGEYAVLYNAAVNTMRTYNTEPTTAHKRNWDTARMSLEELTTRIMAEAAAQALPEVFATQQEVLSYLEQAGYRIKKSALSNHVRSRLLAKKADGFRRKDVDRYAELHLRDAASDQTSKDKRAVALQERKMLAEIKKTEEQAIKAKIEREMLEGKLIDRNDVELELAGRAVVLEAGFDHMVYTRAAEWIELVGGEQSRVDRLIASLLACKDEWLNQYASHEEFSVILKSEGE